MAAPDGIGHLVEEGIIDAVHARLMSGKEATVYVVERQGSFGAAKVYRARNDRTFKKVASYTEGRNQTRNSRDRRAMGKKSSYGRDLMEEGWQDMEFTALRAAFDAGVRVPEPFFVYENVLFMDLVLDAEGAPAPRLADLSYTPEQANEVHLDVFMQVKRLLETGRIHGDLSAYNVLMSAKGPTIIDLPQVVDVARNNNAREILRRDLHNVTEHLARYDARLLRFADCGDALFVHMQAGTLDSVTGPEEGIRDVRGGRRGRDLERGRAGRDKSVRNESASNGAPPRRPGAPARGVQVRAAQPPRPPEQRQRETRGPGGESRSREPRGPVVESRSREARGPVVESRSREPRGPVVEQRRLRSPLPEPRPRDPEGPRVSTVRAEGTPSTSSRHRHRR